MAMASNTFSGSVRVAARRESTIDEALDHALTILDSDGVGAVTVSEIARRMGMRAPSLYKYFPSLHAIYDALFSRGNVAVNAFVAGAAEGVDPGLPRLLAGSRAVLRWSHDSAGLAQLMFWRPVPGFEPSPASYEPSQAMWQRFRADLAAAAEAGELDPTADSDEVLRLLTIVIAGISSQQMANQPGASFEEGSFTSLIDRALAMFVQHHSPRNKKGKR
ncbi:MAG TPA: TetR/AcrR family transcriptional regulator [Mycobacteriales bacterium]